MDQTSARYRSGKPCLHRWYVELSSGTSYCSHTNALTVGEFSARRSALGTKLCLSISVLAGVEMPSKREIIPKFLVEGACLDEIRAASTRELLARFGGSSLTTITVLLEAPLVLLTDPGGRINLSRVERLLSFLTGVIDLFGEDDVVRFFLGGLAACFVCLEEVALIDLANLAANLALIAAVVGNFDNFISLVGVSGVKMR